MTGIDYPLIVTRRTILSPGMVRISLMPQADRRLTSSGFSDEFLRLRLTEGAEAGGTPVTVSLRRFDPVSGAVDIDIVIRAQGRLSQWAQGVQPGARVMAGAPAGLYAPSREQHWQVLAADAAGLPALARILEDSPPTTDTRVFVEVADRNHILPLPAHPRSQVSWLVAGNGCSPGKLAETLTDLPLPAGKGFVWVAGEQKAVRTIRRHLRGTLGLPASGYACVAYWIDRAEAWQEAYRALDTQTLSHMEAVWGSERDAESIRDEVDALLDARGL
ncbi:siderophore-interacting protein [Pararhodobacter sp.]|uniref:siderophore-interacting protein n=1 Tax=Pararhodobacter sp. TaxID=2127056 RepID=UPI002FDCC3E3